MKKESKTLANAKRLCAAGVLSALGFAFMYFGALTGVLDLCAVVVGAVCCAFAVIELSGMWPWLVATVTGALCLLLLPDKFAALEYIALGGLYPILKAYFERLPRVPSWCLKVVCFNLMLTACLLLARFVLGIGEDWVALNVAVYAVANAFFVLYDVALTTFISFYLKRIRGRLKIRF